MNTTINLNSPSFSSVRKLGKGSLRNITVVMTSVLLLVGCGSFSSGLGASENVSIQFESVLARHDPFTSPKGVYVQVTNLSDASSIDTFGIRGHLLGVLQSATIPVVTSVEDADTIVRIDVLDLKVTDDQFNPRGADYSNKLQNIGDAIGTIAVIDALGGGGESAGDLAEAAVAVAAAGEIYDMFGTIFGFKPVWATLVVQVTLIEKTDGGNVGKSTTALAYVKGSKNKIQERLPELQQELVQRVAQLVQ